MDRTTIEIRGMTCGHCVGAVERALRRLEGVDVGSVRVGAAELAYDPSTISAEEIADAVREEGYGAELRPTSA